MTTLFPNICMSIEFDGREFLFAFSRGSEKKAFDIYKNRLLVTCDRVSFALFISPAAVKYHKNVIVIF